jgi:vancomycin resistance protein YoaR
LDATVFVPVVDFKFTNDTPDWLLMETYTNAAGRSLTWKFYSTSDGRTVDWNTTGPLNRRSCTLNHSMRKTLSWPKAKSNR